MVIIKTLKDFANCIKTEPNFDFERDFDFLSDYDKELVIDILTGFLTASSDLACRKRWGFKMAFVVLKSRLRLSLINNKMNL